MYGGPPYQGNNIQDVLREGNFISPKFDVEMDFPSRERKAIVLMLLGIALCLISPLIYFRFAVVPFFGSIILLLGNLQLRKMNKWLGACCAISVLQILWNLTRMILNFIPNTDLLLITPVVVAGHLFSVLGLIQMLCIDRGLEIALRGTEISVDRRVAIGMFAGYAVLVGLSFAPDTEPIVVAKIAVSLLCAWLLYKIYHYLE